MSDADRLPCPVCHAPLSRWRVMLLADWDRLICKTCGTSLRRTSKHPELLNAGFLVWFACYGALRFDLGWVVIAPAAFAIYQSYRANRAKAAVAPATSWGANP